VRGHRFPHEQERWLSAVLLVAAIVGVSLAVRRWPVAAPAARLLASRPLHLIEAPSLPPPAPRVATLSMPPVVDVDVRAPDYTADVPSVAFVVGPADVTPASEPVAPVVAASPSETAIPLLASRRLELSGSAPTITTPDGLATAAPSSSSHSLVDMPAVAVTRVVTVAGRGIRSGLRATGAMFRAAF
jgi:hypothetical protein